MDEEARFRKAVADSVEAAEVVSAVLRQSGWNTKVTPVRIRPTFEERHSYGDAYDLLAWKTLSRQFTFEIKHRRFDFIDCDSFPYPTIAVDRVSKTSPTADYYVSVAKSFGCMAIVSGLTKPQWEIGYIFDNTKGYGADQYLCDKMLAQFRVIDAQFVAQYGRQREGIEGERQLPSR